MELLCNCRFEEHSNYRLVISPYNDRSVCVSCLNFLLCEESVKKIFLKSSLLQNIHPQPGIFFEISSTLTTIDITINDAFTFLPASTLIELTTNILFIFFITITPQITTKHKQKHNTNIELIKYLVSSITTLYSLISIIQSFYEKLISLSSFITTSSSHTNREIPEFVLQSIKDLIRTTTEIEQNVDTSLLLKLSFDFFYHYGIDTTLTLSLKIINKLKRTTANEQVIDTIYGFIKRIEIRTLTNKHLKWIMKTMAKSIDNTSEAPYITDTNNNTKILIKLITVINIMIYNTRSSDLHSHIIELIRKSIILFNNNLLFIDVLNNRTLYDITTKLVEYDKFKIIVELYKQLIEYISSLNNNEQLFIVVLRYYELLIMFTRQLTKKEQQHIFNLEEDTVYIIFNYILIIIQYIKNGYNIKNEMTNFIIETTHRYTEKTNFSEDGVLLFLIVVDSLFITGYMTIEIYERILENNMLMDFIFLINNEDEDIFYKYSNIVFKFFTITQLYVSTHKEETPIDYSTLYKIIKLINYNINVFTDNKLLVLVDVIQILTGNRNYNEDIYIDCISEIKQIIKKLIHLNYYKNKETVQFILHLFIELYQPVSILGYFEYKETFIDTKFLSDSKYNKDLYITQLNGHLLASLSTDITDYNLIESIKPLLFYIVEFVDIKEEITLDSIINLLQLILTLYIKNYSNEVFYYISVSSYLYNVHNTKQLRDFILKTVEITMQTERQFWNNLPVLSIRNVFFYKMLFSTYEKNNEYIVFSFFDYIMHKDIKLKDIIFNDINNIRIGFNSYLKNQFNNKETNEKILSFLFTNKDYVNIDNLTVDIIRYVLDMDMNTLQKEHTNNIIVELFTLFPSTMNRSMNTNINTNTNKIESMLLSESIDKFKLINKESNLKCIYIKIYSYILSSCNSNIFIDNVFIKKLIKEIRKCLCDRNKNIYEIYLIVKWIFSRKINKNSQTIQILYKELFLNSYLMFKTDRGIEMREFITTEYKYTLNINNENNNKELKYIKYIIDNL